MDVGHKPNNFNSVSFFHPLDYYVKKKKVVVCKQGTQAVRRDEKSLKRLPKSVLHPPTSYSRNLIFIFIFKKKKLTKDAYVWPIYGPYIVGRIPAKK